jgi:hypothetical protein
LPDPGAEPERKLDQTAIDGEVNHFIRLFSYISNTTTPVCQIAEHVPADSRLGKP